jgi:hypothetical protein
MDNSGNLDYSRAEIAAAARPRPMKKIKALIKGRKSLDEIKKIFNAQDRPARPGRRRWPSLVETIYLDVTEKKESFSLSLPVFIRDKR